MGCCFSAPEGPPEDYEEKRDKILEATEARMLAQEQRGVGARGAAKLKAEKAAEASSGPVGGSGANMMTWSMV